MYFQFITILKKGGGPLGTPNGFPIFKVADVDGLSAKAKLPTKNFVKCVVFARNCNFVHLIQCNMEDIPCNNTLLAQETLLLSQNNTLLPQVIQKVSKS